MIEAPEPNNPDQYEMENAMTKAILDDMEKSMLLHAAQRHYGKGSATYDARTHRARLASTCEFVTAIVDALDNAVMKMGIRVILELDVSANERGDIRSFVIWHNGVTRIVNASISPDLVRIGSRVVFVGQPEGVEELIQALIALLETEVERIGIAKAKAA